MRMHSALVSTRLSPEIGRRCMAPSLSGRSLQMSGMGTAVSPSANDRPLRPKSGSLVGGAISYQGRWYSIAVSRRPLHLVENRPLGKISDESHRIGRRRHERQFVIEAEISVAPLLARHPRQSGLAALARSMNQDNGRIGQLQGYLSAN